MQIETWESTHSTVQKHIAGYTFATENSPLMKLSVDAYKYCEVIYVSFDWGETTLFSQQEITSVLKVSSVLY